MSDVAKPDILKEKAVYWAPGEPNYMGGSSYPMTPVEINCRWLEESKEFIDSAGRVQVSKAKVYVDSDLLAGGYIWYGKLVDLPNEAITNPTLAGGTLAWEIRKTYRLPNRSGTKFVRHIIL